jgi:hypothetical protein
MAQLIFPPGGTQALPDLSAPTGDGSGGERQRFRRWIITILIHSRYLLQIGLGTLDLSMVLIPPSDRASDSRLRFSHTRCRVGPPLMPEAGGRSKFVSAKAGAADRRV